MKTLKGKTIWVTGASDGIGKALCELMAQEGARLILTARRAEVLETLKKELSGSDHIVLPLDLMNEAEIPAAVNEAVAKAGRIDGIIHSAGRSQRSLILETDFSVDRDIMELDYFSIVKLTKCLLPHMIENGGGLVVGISSIAGKVGTPMRSAYCAAKHALIGFMDSLRAECHDQNIQVMVVTPGSVRTNVSINASTGSGEKHNHMDPAIEKGLAVEQCAQRIISGIKSNTPELLIPSNAKEAAAVYLRRFVPRLFFKMVRNAETT